MAMTPMDKIEPFVDATPLLDTPGQLRERAREEGYLFFKGLVPAESAFEVRRQILELCRRHVWLAEAAPLMDGVVREGVSAIEGRDPRWQAFYCDVMKLRDFHGLAVHPSLMAVFETLFGAQVLAHSRNICRVQFPHTSENSTPPHQDHFYIGGAEETWTNWMPLGDCPVELGSLAVAAGSHRHGMYEVHEAKGAGGHGVDVGAACTWIGGDILCGDVLILHSHMVHQGRDNQSGNRLRLSVDYRYQPLSQPVRSDSLLPHMGWEAWDEIYADWAPDDPLKYYWKNLDLDIVEQSG